MKWELPDNQLPVDSAWEPLGTLSGPVEFTADDGAGTVWTMPHARLTDAIKNDHTFEVTFTAFPDTDAWKWPPEPAKPTWRERLRGVVVEVWDRVDGAWDILVHGFE